MRWSSPDIHDKSIAGDDLGAAARAGADRARVEMRSRTPTAAHHPSDLKPTNILVGKRRDIVIDWGLAKDLAGRSDA
jgi:hypothetical protein